MSGEITTDAPLDYVTFQILQENRYNAFINSNEDGERAGDGLLDQLLDHLPNIKDQLANAPCDNFKLELPDNVNNRAWFRKGTLMRFLHIVGSPGLEKSVAISNEISQLEETRKFHLSLYAKAEDGIASSDNSKNELLRAMDSRIAALMEELVSTFNSGVGGTFSSQEMVDLQQFCQQFADVEISNLLSKLSETSQNGRIVAPLEKTNSPTPFISRDDDISKAGGNNQISRSSNSVKAVKYNASPAKAAEIQRQSSAESEESSFSSGVSGDEQASVERSRTFIRSASPRRSASPMRRIQVGRSGPRRTPALTIKSLSCFPVRERIPSYSETGNDCKSEGSEEPDKKTEVNVMRISVQDAISLFESKQRNQTVDTQNRRSFIDSSANVNKTVMRRWSSGIGESPKSLTQSLPEHTASENISQLEDEDAQKSEEIKTEKGPASENPVPETAKVDTESEMNKETANMNSDNVAASKVEVTSENLDSAEWSIQKEEELSQILMKFGEYNQTNIKNGEPDSGKSCESQLEQRSGIYGHYKQRRDQKLKWESAGKRVEKQTELRAKKTVQEKPKAEKSSVKVNDGGKKQTTREVQNVKKKEPVPLNSKKESPKPAEPKKISSKKSSPLPAVRKSWPSTPLPRSTGTLSAKIPAGSVPSRMKGPPQKSQSPAPRPKPKSPGPISRPSPRAEKSLMHHNDAKKVQVDTKNSLKKVDNVKNQVMRKSGRLTQVMAPEEETKSRKTTKIRNATPEEDTGRSSAKAAGHKRVSKKSSVVPVEAKASPIKVSDMVHLVERDPTIQKAETPAQVEESLSKCEDAVNLQENSGGALSEIFSECEDPGIIQENGRAASLSDRVHSVEGDPILDTHSGCAELEKEIDTEKPKNDGEKEISDEIPCEGVEIAERKSESPAEIHPVQEPPISPAAWEESTHQDPYVPAVDISNESLPDHDTVGSSEPRVRHSLSQMLLEESIEPDVIEWGNAENPPTMVYQKDAPKGLKRLLKFARKNKGETNGAAWASPYTSEGEDEGDEYRTLGGKRNSDNLLRKVTLHSKSYAEGVLSDSEQLSARSHISNRSTRSSNKFQEGHGTTKGARSFFSLSAFRGNKS